MPICVLCLDDRDYVTFKRDCKTDVYYLPTDGVLVMKNLSFLKGLFVGIAIATVGAVA